MKQWNTRYTLMLERGCESRRQNKENKIIMKIFYKSYGNMTL